MLNEEMLLREGWNVIHITPIDDEKVDSEVEILMEENVLEDFDSVKEDYLSRESYFILVPKKDLNEIEGLIEYVNSDDLNMEYKIIPDNKVKIDFDNESLEVLPEGSCFNDMISFQLFMRDNDGDWCKVGDDIKSLLSLS